MSVTPVRPTATAVRWPLPVALAIPALAAALVIAFTPGHSAGFGLIVFGGFALLTAVGSLLGAALLPVGVARRLSLAKGVAALAGGIAAIVIAATGLAGVTVEGAAVALELVIGATLLLIAVADLATGIRERHRDRYARDWIATGVVEALGAVAVVAVPPGFSNVATVRDAVSELTASVMMVGIFGAVAAVLGVLLVIAGITLVPSRARAAA